jgi:hypothetical protein
MASMKGGGRLYLAGAVMLLALTHGTSVAEPSEDSYPLADESSEDSYAEEEPNDDISPGEQDFREATTVRTFVLLGQGGTFTSHGMLTLASEASKYGPVSVHSWYDVNVISAINRETGRVAVVGYSLGANQLGWIGQHITRKVDLGVAYDPSRQSPLARGGVEQIPNFDRVICYYNPGTWFFGGAKLVGPNVELVPIISTHLGLQFRSDLHDLTIAAVSKLREGP